MATLCENIVVRRGNKYEFHIVDNKTNNNNNSGANNHIYTTKNNKKSTKKKTLSITGGFEGEECSFEIGQVKTE